MFKYFKGRYKNGLKEVVISFLQKRGFFENILEKPITYVADLMFHIYEHFQ